MDVPRMQMVQVLQIAQRLDTSLKFDLISSMQLV